LAIVDGRIPECLLLCFSGDKNSQLSGKYLPLNLYVDMATRHKPIALAHVTNDAGFFNHSSQIVIPFARKKRLWIAAAIFHVPKCIKRTLEVLSGFRFLSLFQYGDLQLGTERDCQFY